MLNIATTIADIGNCHWKKGELVQANEVWCKALKYLNYCFSCQFDHRKLMFQKSIQNRIAHIYDACTQTTKVNIKRSKCPLDSDLNLLARLSSDDLLSPVQDSPKLEKNLFIYS